MLWERVAAPAVTDQRYIGISEGKRVVNSRSLTFNLGRRGAYLTIYAKTPTRVRVEVRYQEKPMSICGLRHSDFSDRVGGLSDRVEEIVADATGRMALWLGEFTRVVAAERTPGNLITRALRLVLELLDAQQTAAPENCPRSSVSQTSSSPTKA